MRIFYMLCVILLWNINSNAQCPLGNVTLSTQAEVNQFAIDYPSCTTIDGDLVIQTTSDINDLSPLSNITQVNDALSISGSFGGGASQLTDLEGLNVISVNSLIIARNQALTQIDDLSSLTTLTNGGIGIFENPQLTNLNGLANLVPNGNGNTGELDGNFWIDDNPLVTSIDVFDHITKVNFELKVTDMPGLTNLNGLHNITETNDLIIADNPNITNLDDLNALTKINADGTISDNDSLTTLFGLNALQEVGNVLNISQNIQLQNLTGLENLSIVGSNPSQFGGHLIIRTNNNLTSLNGLNALTTIAGDFTIKFNDNLTDLSALTNLTSVGNIFTIGDNDNLTNLNGLQNLNTIGDRLDINGNQLLANLDALSGLTEVTNRIGISSNPNLANLNGLSNVTTVNSVTIESNDALLNLSGLNGITSLFDLDVRNNNSLTSIDGLNNLSTILRDLEIKSNPSLTDITALSNLTQAGDSNNDDFRIDDNDALQSLDGLQNLTLMPGEVVISDNDSLTDISALFNLTTVGFNLSIAANDALSNLNGFNNLTSIGGDLTIGSNAALTAINGFNSLTQIDRSLVITSNTSLNDIQGFSNLNLIDRSLRIQFNDNLTQVNAFDNLTTINQFFSFFNNNSIVELDAFSNLSTVDDAFSIQNNALLENIEGFESLTTLNDDFNIRNNTALVSFPAFRNLTQIGEDLVISGNQSLKNLNDLENLNEIGTNIDISFNDSLIDITGLNNLTSIGTNMFDFHGRIVIWNNAELATINGLQKLDINTVDDIRLMSNPKLSICNLTNFCNYLSDPANARIISGNLGNCFDDTAILNVCSSCTAETTWDGTAWSNGQPNATTKAIFNGDYTETGTLETCDLEVKPNTKVDIKGVLKLNGNLDNFGEFTFKSDASGSGQLDEVLPTSIVDCNIGVERFIPAGDNNRRAFRFLASAVKTSSFIRENWQEDATSNTDDPNPGFGTHITGSTIDGMNGFDATISGNPSLLLFDNTIQAWSPIDNTNRNTLDYNTPYNLFVRGSRGIDLSSSSQSPNNTTLRANGTPATGNIDIATHLAQSDGEFSLVSNPYQAIVDFNNLTFTGDINSNNLYIWNANASTEGAYEIIDNTTPAQQMIQPGQSFFVQNSATVSTAPGLEFTEAAKNTSGMVTSVFDVSQIAIADIALYNSNNLKLDVVKFRFEAGANNNIDDFDGGKLLNPSENIAAVNSNTLLALERRDIPQDNETISLFVNQFQFSQYEFRLNTSNWDETTVVYIVDNYLNTETIISDNQAYSFSVDSNIPESIASDRFSLKFDNTTLSDHDNTLANGFSLYPNPTNNGLFSIKAQSLSAENASVKIYSLTGHEVLSQTFENHANNEFNVDASQLSTGVYMLEFINGEQSVTRKLIIQ